MIDVSFVSLPFPDDESRICDVLNLRFPLYRLRLRLCLGVVFPTICENRLTAMFSADGYY